MLTGAPQIKCHHQVGRGPEVLKPNPRVRPKLYASVVLYRQQHVARISPAPALAETLYLSEQAWR